MDRTIVLISTNTTETSTFCPNCSSSPGLGMALTEPVRCRRHARMVTSLATCSCGATYPVYWRALNRAALGVHRHA